MLSRRHFLIGLAGSVSLPLLPTVAAAAPTARPAAPEPSVQNDLGPYPSADLYPNDTLHPEG